jgi:hypothetical protein
LYQHSSKRNSSKQASIVFLDEKVGVYYLEVISTTGDSSGSFESCGCSDGTAVGERNDTGKVFLFYGLSGDD